MIRVEGLVKKFGRFLAVDGLSFNVRPGEAATLWGPNGAGKTTAIRCILGLLRCSGRMEIAGHDARRRGKAARRCLGYVPQELSFYDDLTALETLHFYGRLKRVGADRPSRTLHQVGLAVHARKRVRELSGGMKQRLALAAALLADPPLLVLDELTSNLDAEAQAGFMSLLQQLKADGKTILFTSHHLHELEVLADRVLVLETGRLRLECRPSELAETLNLRSRLKLYVAEEAVDRAVETLRSRGIAATRNGAGLHVDVPLREKARPLQMLSESMIAVRDFDVICEHVASNGKGVRHV